MSTKYDEFENDENATADDMAFSIHTITLRCPFANMERSLVKDKLCRYCSRYEIKYYKERVGNHVYWNFELRDRLCVNRVTIWDLYSDGVMVRSGIDITLNPRHFFHRDDHPFTYIADQEDLNNVTEYLNKMINELELGLETHMFIVHRIDLCANIKLSSREEVKSYMRIMKKGAYAYNGKRKMELSKTQKKQVPTKNSFTVSGKSYEFTVYDKYKQMSTVGREYSSDELENGMTQIRLELRVKRSKEKRIEEKYRLNTIEDVMRLVKIISETELNKFVRKSYGAGCFIKYNNAKNVIENSNYHNKTKDRMINFMKLASKNNLEVAKEYYADYYSNLMKCFNHLGISPITLPSRSAYSLLKNPIQYIKDFNNKN